MSKSRHAKHAQRVQAQLAHAPTQPAPPPEVVPTKQERVAVICLALVLRNGARVEIPIAAAATVELARKLAKEMSQNIVSQMQHAAVKFPGGQIAPLGNAINSLLHIMAVEHTVMETKVAQSELVVAQAPSIILAKS